MVRIVIVDDHELVREGLRKVLQNHRDFMIVGEASDSSAALEIVRSLKPDVLILDVNLPGRSGLDVLKDIRFQQPLIRVLILSIYPEERFALRALRAGASGYVPKEAAATLIVDAIRTVISGRRFLTPGVVDLMARSLEETEGQLFDEELSPRELSVLVLLAEGKSVRDIARRLTITMNTVYTYRRRLLGKLGLHSNVELTRYAIQRKLVS